MNNLPDRYDVPSLPVTKKANPKSKKFSLRKYLKGWFNSMTAYYTHLPKLDRKGKKSDEIQALRSKVYKQRIRSYQNIR